MDLTIYQVDAFTDKPFAGNPAAVCILPQARDERWMQDVAREMNLSETAFLLREDDGFRLRWFTPAVEVDLCGHATLASAHILWQEGHLAQDQQARFHTRSGLLTADRGADGWIEMDFPAQPPAPVEAPPPLLAALGIGEHVRFVGKNIFDYLIEVETEEVVCGLQPDMAMLAQAPTRGVMVTSRASSPGFDFVSRFFAPRVGVNEDPVTGSAHCCLAPYWSKQLGKDEMRAYQASLRGGVVRMRVVNERVKLAGQAVSILRGDLAW